MMQLNKNVVTVTKEINTIETWQVLGSPMGGDVQWKDGRSAKELARYITGCYPALPDAVERVLSRFASQDASFDWKVEYETGFSHLGYGKGMGRNHDMVIYNDDIFVGIEAKADEPFGDKTIEEELKSASDNKKNRIKKLVELVFGDEVKKHLDLRYQLLTACGAVLLEAQERHSKSAMLLVLVFLKSGTDESGNKFYEEENRQRNNEDWERFLLQADAKEVSDGCYEIPTKNGIHLYAQKIEIPLE